MNKKKLNIAVFSPNQNPYSETFIQAHKERLNGNIFYYYGNGEGTKLENNPPIFSKLKRFLWKLFSQIFNKPNHFLASKLILDSLKKNRIDVLLIEYGTHAKKLLWVMEKSDIPAIVHFHGIDASYKTYVESPKYYSEVFRLAHKVIAVSIVMEQTLLSIGCPREKLVYNVYGPRPEFEKVKPLFNKKQFIAVGRFTDKKAPYYSILAFKNVLTQHPDAQLLMAGQGALMNTCKNLVKHFEIQANVRFLGIINSEDYIKLLTESLAFLQHSITAENGDQEGTPLSILEASAAGLPIISTYHAGIPDVIEHGVTGLLCEEHNVEAMSTNMISLLNDINLAKQLGNSGKIRIRERFNLEKHIQNIEFLFNEIARGK